MSPSLFEIINENMQNTLRLFMEDKLDLSKSDIHDAVADVLTWAAEIGCVETINLLVSKNFDVNVTCFKTALSFSAENGHVEIVKLLIASGADIDATSLMQTPLHFASRNGHTEVVKLLIMEKANLNATDIIGCTASQLANIGGHTEIEMLLIQAILLENPEAKKPDYLQHIPCNTLSIYWDKLSKGINYLLKERVIACESTTKNVLARSFREKSNTLLAQASFCFFKNYYSIKKINYSEIDKIASNISPTSR